MAANTTGPAEAAAAADDSAELLLRSAGLRGRLKLEPDADTPVELAMLLLPKEGIEEARGEAFARGVTSKSTTRDSICRTMALRCLRSEALAHCSFSLKSSNTSVREQTRQIGKSSQVCCERKSTTAQTIRDTGWGKKAYRAKLTRGSTGSGGAPGRGGVLRRRSTRSA
jgi:hypothetical protein